MAKRQKSPQQQNHFELKRVDPLTDNQRRTFEAYEQGENLLIHGYAGTGKTYVPIYLALRDVLGRSSYRQLLIVRSTVPSRDMGFLPGNSKEKAREYEKPYVEICNDLFGRGEGYDILKQKRIVYFSTTSFLRGTTFEDSIVIVDEIQNMTFQELDTVMTRIGSNTKVIFCGDFRQTDLERGKEGLQKFMSILKRLEQFTCIEYGIEDIVRSGIVKDYIIARTDLGL